MPVPGTPNGVAPARVGDFRAGVTGPAREAETEESTEDGWKRPCDFRQGLFVNRPPASFSHFPAGMRVAFIVSNELQTNPAAIGRSVRFAFLPVTRTFLCLNSMMAAAALRSVILVAISTVFNYLGQPPGRRIRIHNSRRTAIRPVSWPDFFPFVESGGQSSSLLR